MSPLADLLGKHLHRTHTSVNRLAKLSGVPQRTISNWLNGYIRKPHQWQTLLKVALALHLPESETNTLLQSAGHPPLSTLRAQTTTDSDLTLLSQYPISNTQYPFHSPFQAIADLPTFVGRESELETVKRAVLDGGRAAICGLRGMGGVGKTTLAAHLAYHVRDQFPDGVLWARLDTSDPLSILGAFADAYGKDVSQYKDVESRAAVVRNLLAGKRALVVLDNVETSAQVRPMLPPSTGICAVLITTRQDLSVLDGWDRLTLEPFDAESEESLQLFREYLGEGFVDRHQIALREIAALLGHLPLALAIAAGQLAFARPRLPEEADGVAALLAALKESHTRLDALTRDDLGVRASFDVSHAALTPGQQAFFASLGVFGGEDFSAEAVAYTTETALETTLEKLHLLLALSLVQESRAGRWRLHPLMRDYAQEKLTSTSGPERAGFEARMVDYYIQLVESCPLDQQARFVLEIDNLWAALETAKQQGYETLLIRAALSFWELLRQRDIPIRMEGYFYQALHGAKTIDDLSSQASLHYRLAYLQWWQGKDAGPDYTQALALARQANQPALVCKSLRMLGMLARISGDYNLAKQHYQEALSLAYELYDSDNICSLLNNLGHLYLTLSAFDEAQIYLQTALPLARQTGDSVLIIMTLQNLGYMYSLKGQYEQAEVDLQEAENLTRQINRNDLLLGILGDRADAALRAQILDTAENNALASLEIAHTLGFFQGESDALARLGEVARRRQQFPEALTFLQKALSLAEDKELHASKACALFSLARLSADQDDSESAATQAQASLALFTTLHHPLAAEVHAWLESLP